MTTDDFHTLSPDENPLRSEVITEKVPSTQTGFKSSVFIHIGFETNGDGQRRVTDVRFSESRKDGNTLDGLLTAIGDAVTDIIRREIHGEPSPTA